jgi:geranylgeranyl diphosphate synthase type II
MDDLPAMDDASLRRGRPTLHITYGDDIALLAALALLNESYALFAATPSLLPLAVREIGASGMIGGQAVDVSGARHRGRLEKTTALTRLTMAAGALAARASAHHTDVLIQFGDALGEAYQICDDIVDALDTGAASGKTSNQDSRNERCNCLHQLGHTAAVERVADLIESSTTRLRHCFGPTPQTAMLEDFARVLVTRTLNLVENDPALALAGMSGAGLVERPQLAGS